MVLLYAENIDRYADNRQLVATTATTVTMFSLHESHKAGQYWSETLYSRSLPHMELVRELSIRHGVCIRVVYLIFDEF